MPVLHNVITGLLITSGFLVLINCSFTLEELDEKVDIPAHMQLAIWTFVSDKKLKTLVQNIMSTRGGQMLVTKLFFEVLSGQSFSISRALDIWNGVLHSPRGPAIARRMMKFVAEIAVYMPEDGRKPLFEKVLEKISAQTGESSSTTAQPIFSTLSEDRKAEIIVDMAKITLKVLKNVEQKPITTKLTQTVEEAITGFEQHKRTCKDASWMKQTASSFLDKSSSLKYAGLVAERLLQHPETASILAEVSTNVTAVLLTSATSSKSYGVLQNLFSMSVNITRSLDIKQTNTRTTETSKDGDSVLEDVRGNDLQINAEKKVVSIDEQLVAEDGRSKAIFLKAAKLLGSTWSNEELGRVTSKSILGFLTSTQLHELLILATKVASKDASIGSNFLISGNASNLEAKELSTCKAPVKTFKNIDGVGQAVITGIYSKLDNSTKSEIMANFLTYLEATEDNDPTSQTKVWSFDTKLNPMENKIEVSFT